MADVLCMNCGEQIWDQNWQKFNLQRVVDAEEDAATEKCPYCLKSDYIDLSRHSTIHKNSAEGKSSVFQQEGEEPE